MFYVYGVHEPDCICSSRTYSFSEFDDENDAQWEAANLSFKSYDVTIINGEKVPFDKTFLERLKKAREVEREKR